MATANIATTPEDKKTSIASIGELNQAAQRINGAGPSARAITDIAVQPSQPVTRQAQGITAQPQGIATSVQAGPLLRSIQAGARQGGIAAGWQQVPQAQVQQADHGIGAPIDATKARADFMVMDRQTSQATTTLPAYQTPTRGITAGMMEAANTAARDPARKSIAYVDRFNLDAASRGMDVQKVVGKDGSITYTDNNPNMGKQFTNHGMGIAGPLTGNQIGQEQRRIDTANAQDAQQTFERSQLKPADRIKLDSAQARMGLDQARADKATAEAAHVGDVKEPKITLAQQSRNAMIDAARGKLSGMTTNDVLAKTQQFTATGRENPNFDPELARSYKLANTRKIGADEAFDQFAAAKSGQPGKQQIEAAYSSNAEGQGQLGIEQAQQQTDQANEWAQQARAKHKQIAESFAADQNMKGYRLGNPTDQGMEVLDGSGNIVGHYN